MRLVAVTAVVVVVLVVVVVVVVATKFRECSFYSLRFDLLPKNLKIKIHKTAISPVALYGCEI